MICLRRRNKVQRPKAIEAILFVDLLKLLRKFRELIPDALETSRPQPGPPAGGIL